jgi:Cu2+-exporting ATPase
MSATYKGQSVKLGSRNWCGGQDAPAHDGPELWLSINGKVQCVFRFRDVLRDDAAQAIDALKALGFDAQKDIHILSGDAKASVAFIAEALGLPQYHAGMKPDEKYQMLVQEMKKGRKVLMVGDGLNDAAVLTGAHVSIAPGNAIDMAQNTADMIFMERSFLSVPLALKIARRAQSLVRQNIGIAFVYNIMAVPIAFMGVVTPMIAALAMSGSSILVVMNSFRLNKGEDKDKKSI